MIKNKVVIKERDARSDLANFIGEMVAKYADAMELDQLPDPDNLSSHEENKTVVHGII